MTAKVPDRLDVFQALATSYKKLETAIVDYRQLMSYFQNPGVEYDDEDLKNFYEAYVQWRAEIATTFMQDMQMADKVFAEAQDLLASGLGPMDRTKASASTQPPTATLVYTTSPHIDSEEVDAFRHECDEVLALLDTLPERAQDFADGVREKIEGMREWAEEHDKVTPKMEGALQNMRTGAERWLNH